MQLITSHWWIFFCEMCLYSDSLLEIAYEQYPLIENSDFLIKKLNLFIAEHGMLDFSFSLSSVLVSSKFSHGTFRECFKSFVFVSFV